MPNLPQGHRPLQCVIDGVTYQGDYWVDGHIINVFTEYGHSSTEGLRTGTNFQRDEANKSRAQGLFEAVIRGHLAGYQVP